MGYMMPLRGSNFHSPLEHLAENFGGSACALSVNLSHIHALYICVCVLRLVLKYLPVWTGPVAHLMF